MSKLENQRDPGKYDSVEKAKELAGYVIRLTSNEKKFPKRYRFTVTEKIINRALSIADCLAMANEIFPNTVVELDRRILYMKEARASCRSLLLMVEVAANTFNVQPSTFRELTVSVKDLKKHVTAWIEKDKERFKKIYRGTDYK